MRITFLGNFGVDFSSESHHAKSLEALGHTVDRLQEREATARQVLNSALDSKLFVWVHTHNWETPPVAGLDMRGVLTELKKRGIPSCTYHLDLWFGLERQKDLEGDPFYKEIEHFFVTDKLMADWLNENTKVKGYYLPPAVFHEEAIMLPPSQGKPHKDVIFVGSRGYHPEWQWRPQLIDYLKETFGERFEHFGGDGLGVVRGMRLNQLYADTKVVVGDSLCLGFDYPYYWSDRVPETMGRGGFLLMPTIKGMEKFYSSATHLRNFDYGNFKQLSYFIKYYLEHEEEREKIRRQGFENVRDNHTYKHRWKHILETLGLK